MIPPMIRVMYADDHPVTRDGIEKALNNAARIKIAGVAEDFEEVLRLLPTVHADVVVLDIIGMRGSPIAMVERITREYPGTHVIMFSSSVTMVPEMLHAGAKAYIVKDEVTDYLVEAIYAVCAGETFLSPLAQEYMDNYTTQAAHLHLTQRERDVLNLLIQGCSTDTIAEQLKVDPRSVHNYIFQLRKKIGCESRMDLCNWYRRLYGEVSTTAADQKIVRK